MKALRTKVILSGIVLVFAFIATIGTTFAWFTVSTDTTVDSMELNVTAADNLLITPFNESATYVLSGNGETFEGDEGTVDLLTASNYQTRITVDDMIAAGYLYDNPTELTGAWGMKPATVINSAYDGFNGKILNSIDVNDRTLSPLGTGNFNNAGGFYMQLRFWVLSQAGNSKEVEIDNLAIDTNETGTKAAVANAARMSIWFDDSVDPLSGAAGTNAGAAFIFGNDSDYDYVFTDDVFTSGTLGDSLNEVADQVNETTGSVLQTTAAEGVLLTGNTADLGTDLYTVQNMIPTLVTVLIYVEGWDAQATNSIIQSSFNISFGFKFSEDV
ncbi:hypothetical protein KHQ88_05675 [Mycoplasmatota bacterium]|nr:hypothetical protein KHQ88_05675 [Mycoplasmatota bacterium]